MKKVYTCTKSFAPVTMPCKQKKVKKKKKKSFTHTMWDCFIILVLKFKLRFTYYLSALKRYILFWFIQNETEFLKIKKWLMYTFFAFRF